MKRLEFDIDIGMIPEFVEAETEAYFQIWLDDGTPILRSHSLGQKDLAYLNTPLNTPVTANTSLPDGRAGRIIRYRFLPRFAGQDNSSPRSTVLAVARDSTELQDFLRFLFWLLAGCTWIVVALSLLVGLKVVPTYTRVGSPRVVSPRGREMIHWMATISAREVHTHSAVSMPLQSGTD